jgi:predicted dehydrogenase
MMALKSTAPRKSNGKIRVAVIGVGYLGKFHAEKYARMANVELVGVVDTDRPAADAVAMQLGVQAWYHHGDVIGRVDAVSIAVPTPAHFSISRDFLDHDVDVLIEKPITLRLEEADELIELAARRGCLIQVGHLERFNPAVTALTGIVHDPRFIESHRVSIFKDRGTDVSVVLDLMIHDIDIILNFVRSPIKTIHAAGISVISGHVDIANARLAFQNGCVANVTASRISAKNERKIRMFQKEGYILVDFANQGITLVRPSERPEASVIPGMAIEQIRFDHSDALNEELKSFIAAVIARRPPEVTGQMGRDALNIALSIMEQIRQTTDRVTG